MHVVATAGHVDAGKSALVRALTGMEPDRWAQERRRGMTIDLGYVWTELPSGQAVAFVDVPGHQRFIGNMLAGLGPAPAVLFVVAADAGWQAQSQEHLAAMTALGLRHVVLAVTRSDLADPTAALREAARQLGLAGVEPVASVAVSSIHGQGLDRLTDALGRLVAQLPAPDQEARVRLWVDRSFTIRGSGTVVTGTLSAGTVRVGDTLDLRGRAVQVRSLQALGRPRETVVAAARVAVNLRATSSQDVARGDALLGGTPWLRTAQVDVRLDTAMPRDRLPADLVLHVGTAAVAVHPRPLADDLVRLQLQEPLPLLAGDRAILRDPAAQRLVAGVLVLDPDPPALRRRGAAAARAAQLAAADGRRGLAAEVARRGAVSADRLWMLGFHDDQTAEVVRTGGWLVAPVRWARWGEMLAAAVDAHALANPLDPRPSLDAASRAVGLPSSDLVAALADSVHLEVSGGRLGRSGAVADLGEAERGFELLVARLRGEPFRAPERADLDEWRLGPAQLAAAARAGRILRLPGEILLLPGAPERAVATLRELAQPFTLSAAREALHTTRRVAVPLLEYLDAHGDTRRIDAIRRVVVEPQDGQTGVRPR